MSIPTTTCDVVVIGAGPAGLTAALRLATASLSVVLIDEQAELGGQYYRRPSAATLARVGDHRPAGGRLVAGVRAAGVDCRTSTTVWGVGSDGTTVLTSRAGGHGPVEQVAARFVVVATGAYEHLVPFPGWQLLGVTSVGFAQHLAAGDHTPIGQRVLLAGSGPFLLPVACSLLELGVDVVGVAEAGFPYRPTLRRLTAAAFPARMAELAGYAARLARHRVPVWQGRVVARAEAGGSGRHVSSVSLARVDAPRGAVATHQVDALCIGMGFRPQTELVRMLGCAMVTDLRTADLVPHTDGQGRTSQPHVYVAGETTGIGGAQLAVAEAEVVAATILARAGRDSSARPFDRAVRRARRFVALTNSVFPSTAELTRTLAGSIDDDVRVCRCEAVTAGEIRRASLVAGQDVAAVKGLTRAGMGPCQGRECSATVAALSGTAPGRPFAVRMPIRPLSLAALAAVAEPDLMLGPAPVEGASAEAGS